MTDNIYSVIFSPVFIAGSVWLVAVLGFLVLFAVAAIALFYVTTLYVMLLTRLNSCFSTTEHFIAFAKNRSYEKKKAKREKENATDRWPDSWTKPNPNGCWCRECNPHLQMMILCPTCGNKRCPKAENHIFECGDSNEPNQTKVLAGNKA